MRSCSRVALFLAFFDVVYGDPRRHGSHAQHSDGVDTVTTAGVATLSMTTAASPSPSPTSQQSAGGFSSPGFAQESESHGQQTFTDTYSPTSQQSTGGFSPSAFTQQSQSQPTFANTDAPTSITNFAPTPSAETNTDGFPSQSFTQQSPDPPTAPSADTVTFQTATSPSPQQNTNGFESPVFTQQNHGPQTVTVTDVATFTNVIAPHHGVSGIPGFSPVTPPGPPGTTVFITVHTTWSPGFPTSLPSVGGSSVPIPSLPNPSSSPVPPAGSQSSAAGPSPTPGAGKRGLSYNDPSLLSYFKNKQITWSYNWASDPYWGNQAPNTYSKSLAFIPMLWSTDPALTSVWRANVATARKSYNADAVLAFNEPDGCCASCGQSCISPSVAASAYKQYIQPLRKGLELGAPAVTNGVGPNIGMDWMVQFLQACSGCTVDFIPLHWYGSATDPDSFKGYVRQFHQRFKKPIWITEFGTDGGSEEQVLAFLKAVLPWLDRQKYVVRYAYFMDRAAGSPFLLNTDDSLTSIGQYYDRS